MTTLEAPPKFLSDSQTVSGSDTVGKGVANVNGVSYTNSIWADLDCSDPGQQLAFQYEIGHQYGTFKAVIGESDTSPPDVLQFEVKVDDVSVGSPYRLTRGQSVPLNLNIGHGRILKLSVTVVSYVSPCEGADLAVWGGAEIIQ